MRTNLLMITTTGVVGLGARVGVAAAGPNGRNQPARTMDDMHATMRDAMPGELADECDAMHAARPEAMRQLRQKVMAPIRGGTGAGHDQRHEND